MDDLAARPQERRLPRFERSAIGHFEITDDDIEILTAIAYYRVIRSDQLDLLFARSGQGLCDDR